MDFSYIDELLKDGKLSDEEIAERSKVPVNSVKDRREQINVQLKRAKSAKPIDDLIGEHLKASRQARMQIISISNELLEHIHSNARMSPELTADEIAKHCTSLVKIDGLLKSSGDETVDAILKVVEADILPEKTSAEIISAFESNHENLRRETRRRFLEVSTTKEQFELFD